MGCLVAPENHLAEVVRSKPRKPVYRANRHIPTLLGLFGDIRVPYLKGLNCLFHPLQHHFFCPINTSPNHPTLQTHFFGLLRRGGVKNVEKMTPLFFGSKIMNLLDFFGF